MARADHLPGLVRVADITMPQVSDDNRLDGHDEHANPDVPMHSRLGEVVHGVKPEEVLQHRKAVLGRKQSPKRAQHLSDGKPVGGVRGQQHVAASAEVALVVERGFVTGVEELALSDL